MPPDLEAHIVLDTDSLQPIRATHKTRIVHNWLVRRPRFHLHITPASASWRNLIECWFVVLSWRRLERGCSPSFRQQTSNSGHGLGRT